MSSPRCLNTYSKFNIYKSGKDVAFATITGGVFCAVLQLRFLWSIIAGLKRSVYVYSKCLKTRAALAPLG